MPKRISGIWLGVLGSLALGACAGSGSVPTTSGSSQGTAWRPPPTRTFVGWLQPGLNPAHTADNGLEKTLTRSNVGTLKLGWSFPTGGSSLDGASILTDGSTAYAGSGDGHVYAINIATGAQTWSFATQSTGETGSGIAIGGGVVYAAPCFVGSNTQGAGLCAVNAKTGRLRWNWYSTCGCQLEPFIVTGPVVSGTTAVFVYRTGGAYGKDYVIALSTTNGAVLWQTVGGMGNPSGSVASNVPAISGGNVYLGTDAGVCSLQLSSGSLNWCTGPNASSGSLAVAKDVVYVTNVSANQGVFYAYNATTGTQIWTYTPPSGYFGYLDPPAIYGSKVYFAANQEGPIYALNATNGSLIFTAGAGSQGAKTLSSPSVANGVVYVACYAGLCAYNASTGAQLLVT
ncbi:MAG: PQQ-binding-like beta-propeller repeat protein, partial [Candidatus Eremiobacteraeota bacterium]|nr:PQQ-binding-like beta-propeller repeat protein [Candidatus Eremiobacteraeota bacterium]